jgi:hypothetical protein
VTAVMHASFSIVVWSKVTENVWMEDISKARICCYLMRLNKIKQRRKQDES